MTEKAKKPNPPQQSHVESNADPQPKPAQKEKTAKTAMTTLPIETAPENKKKTSAPKAQKLLKSAKPTKQKMVRDSFTLPENDYANLNILKTKCLEKGIEIKKSEIVRAGLIALTKLSIDALIKAVGEVERLKTGRPKSK